MISDDETAKLEHEALILDHQDGARLIAEGARTLVTISAIGIGIRFLANVSELFFAIAVLPHMFFVFISAICCIHSNYCFEKGLVKFFQIGMPRGVILSVRIIVIGMWFTFVWITIL